MKKLFSRQPVNTDVQPLALTEHQAEPDRTTTISNPDTRTPLPHSANRMDPHEHAEAYRDLVRQAVADLAASGGFDQDNLEAVSQQIASLARTWLQKVEQDAVSRTEIAQLLVAQSVQDKTAVSSELATARTTRAEISDARAGILSGWGFTSHVAATVDGTLATAEPAVPSRVQRIVDEARATATAPAGSVDDEPTEASAVIGLPFGALTDDRDPSNPTIHTEELSA